jgi:hypothetical protein
MASTRTTTRTIRIDNETADYFKEKALNRAVESLYGLLRSGKLTFDGEELKIECTHQNEKKQGNNSSKNAECVHQKAENVCTPTEKAYQSIVEMAGLMRISPEKLFEDFNGLLESGELYYSGGKLRNPRYEEFEDVCEEKRVNIDNMLMKVIRDIDNGK